MMNGLEVGRIQVASRSLGVGRAALEDALRYSQERHAFDVPIWRHQSVANYLADSATKLEAARQLVHYAADVFDSGRRADMEASAGRMDGIPYPCCADSMESLCRFDGTRAARVSSNSAGAASYLHRPG